MRVLHGWRMPIRFPFGAASNFKRRVSQADLRVAPPTRAGGDGGIAFKWSTNRFDLKEAQLKCLPVCVRAGISRGALVPSGAGVKRLCGIDGGFPSTMPVVCALHFAVGGRGGRTR